MSVDLEDLRRNTNYSGTFLTTDKLFEISFRDLMSYQMSDQLWYLGPKYRTCCCYQVHDKFDVGISYDQHIYISVDHSLLYDNGTRIERQKFDFDSEVELHMCHIYIHDLIKLFYLFRRLH